MRIPARPVAIAAIVLGVAVALYALLSRKSDEELIKERVERLALVVGVDGDENPLFRARRLDREFAEIFVPDVRVEAPELTGPGGGRDALVAAATRAGSTFRHAEISLSHEKVELGPAAKSAKLAAVAVLTGDGGEGPRRDERHVVFGLIKTGDGWRVDSVSVAGSDPAP